MLAAAVVALSSLGQGCDAACDTSYENNPAQLFDGGITSNGIYDSSPLDDPFLYFPGGKYFQLKHRLGFRPEFVTVSQAFEEHPTKPYSISATGNEALVCADDQYVWVKNDQCADFWIRVQAWGDLGVLPDGAPSCASAFSSTTEADATASEASPADDAATQDVATSSSDDGSADR